MFAVKPRLERVIWPQRNAEPKYDATDRLSRVGCEYCFVHPDRLFPVLFIPLIHNCQRQLQGNLNHRRQDW